jgi:hypothetical protein
MVEMDRELRDWLRGLAVPTAAAGRTEPEPLSDAGAEYLARIARDGTLKAALAKIAASDPDLAS